MGRPHPHVSPGPSTAPVPGWQRSGPSSDGGYTAPPSPLSRGHSGALVSGGSHSSLPSQAAAPLPSLCTTWPSAFCRTSCRCCSLDLPFDSSSVQRLQRCVAAASLLQDEGAPIRPNQHSLTGGVERVRRALSRHPSRLMVSSNAGTPEGPLGEGLQREIERLL